MENTNTQFVMIASNPSAITACAMANLDDTVRPFVSAFVGFANKSAANVLEMCKIVAEAKRTLSDTLFNQFCLALGLNPKANTISKWKKIGDRYALLSQYKQHLPCAWTTLYRLSDMSDEAFVAAIAKSYINVAMTAKDLNTIAPSKKKNGKKRGGKPATVEQAQANVDAAAEQKARLFFIKCQTSISDETKQQIEDALLQLCGRFNVELVAA